jgi:hypothetical protein
MGEAGQEKARERFTLDRMLSSVETLYKDLANLTPSNR